MKSFLKKIITKILLSQAKFVLKKYKPKIVAVTGSVGKTSTKDAVYTAFAPFYHVRKSAKSFNSEIGIPLTILGLPNGWGNLFVWIKNIIKGYSMILTKKEYPEWLILEIGADKPGDIKRLCAFIKPDIGILTRIGEVPVHVEFYKSAADVVREKSNLAKAVKNDGVVILNADDKDILALRHEVSARVITYGITNQADVVGSNSSITYDEKGNPNGMTMKVDVGGNSIPVKVAGVLGRQHLYPILAAMASAYSRNLNLLEVANSFIDHDAPKGRMNIIEAIDGAVIIDDTYNASPVAVEEGLNILGEIENGGKKIAILGDMLELGKFSGGEHSRLGALAAVKANILIAVGIRGKYYVTGALEGKMKKKFLYHVDTPEEAAEIAKGLIDKGDTIYVKGSQGMRMEKCVALLMKDPSQKEKLLVRQEREWGRR